LKKAIASLARVNKAFAFIGKIGNLNIHITLIPVREQVLGGVLRIVKIMEELWQSLLRYTFDNLLRALVQEFLLVHDI